MEIPNIKLDEQKKVVEETRNIPIKINQKEAVVVIKKLSTGARNKIRSECTNTKIIGGQPSVTVNETEIQEKILTAAIKEAPFDATIQGIKELPAEVTDYLFGEYRDFAEPTDKKKD